MGIAPLNPSYDCYDCVLCNRALWPNSLSASFALGCRSTLSAGCRLDFGQPLEQLFTAAICQVEVLAGIAVLPESRRRSAPARAAQAMFHEDFAERILPFDAGTAETYTDLFAIRRRSGRPTATMDLMIAAIARVPAAGRLLTRGQNSEHRTREPADGQM
jgi:predicted nucleic acid-binding protein